MRSASLRCAIEMIEMRGLPSAVNSRRCTSSGSPLIQAAKPGEASRLLMRHRELEPLLRRKERLQVEGAELVERPASARPGSGPSCRATVPVRHAPSRMFASRMCSRMLIGSASMPSRPAVPTPPSRRARAARRRPPAARPAARERTQHRQRQARSPRPACRSPRRRRRAACRCAPASGPTRPGRSSRCRPSAAAYCAALSPLRAASPASTHGSKSAAARFGNVSSRLPRSPLGSMQIAGMPSIAASSSSDRHRPVLPLPVMPTQTACVVRSFES